MSAIDLKERGNAHFKAGRFVQAAGEYAKAEKLSPKDPVYSSNLSAALYEAGDYTACFLAIIRSSKLLLAETDRNNSLIDRVSTRLARTLRYGIRSGRLSYRFVTSDSAKGIITELKRIQETSENEDLKKAWEEWEQVENTMNKVAEESASARERLVRLPSFKASADPALEYFSISHDDIMSLSHDLGPRKESALPLKVESFSAERLSKIAFLFGGVADARHVFGSMVGLYQTYKQISQAKQSKFRAHFTLLDIQPTALARDLCILLLLDDLMAGDHDAEETAEIRATLFYVYVAPIMPSYCDQRTARRLRDVLSSPQPILPSWLYVSPESMPAIVRSLDYWLAHTGEKTTKAMLAHHNPEKQDEETAQALANIDESSPYKIFACTHEERKVRVGRAGVEQVVEWMALMSGGKQPMVPPGAAQRTLFLAKAKEWLLKTLQERDAEVKQQKDGKISAVLQQEKGFYKSARAFVLPSVIMKRHKAFASLWAEIRRCSPSKAQEYAPNASLATEVIEEVSDSWRPNLSLFDVSLDSDAGDGYPVFDFDAFFMVQQLEDFDVRMKLQGVGRNGEMEESPAYSVVRIFFDAVMESINGFKDRMQLEMICGELGHELSKIQRLTNSSRPSHFPSTFTRMWLSNVPDYTHGPLNTAVYVVPSVQSEPGCFVAANCLRNTGAWRDGDEFCYTYTLLLPQDLSRHLGCQVIQMSPGFENIILSSNKLPLSLKELATKGELFAWLTRILLAILVPPKPHRSQAVSYPSNLVAFVDIVIHLHSVGFPTHWLSEYIQKILTDSLMTETPLYRGTFPIPPSEFTKRTRARKVHLKPWHLDFESIIATSYGAFPFPLSLPAGFAISHADIGLFETTIRLDEFDKKTSVLPDIQHAPNLPVVSLIFYKLGQYPPSATALPFKIGDILDGERVAAPGDLYILTCVERYSVKDGIIRWRMNKRKVQEMKKEKWVMISYRCDHDELLSPPNLVKHWREVHVE